MLLARCLDRRRRRFLVMFDLGEARMNGCFFANATGEFSAGDDVTAIDILY